MAVAAVAAATAAAAVVAAAAAVVTAAVAAAVIDRTSDMLKVEWSTWCGPLDLSSGHFSKWNAASGVLSLYEVRR